MAAQPAPDSGDIIPQMETLLARSVRVGAFLVLLLPLVVNHSPPLPDTYFPFIVGKALYGRILIEIIVGLWVVLAMVYPAYRPPRSWLVVIFLVYLGIALLAGITGVSFLRSMWSTYERMQGVIDLAHWFAFTVVLASVFRSMGHWRTLFNVNLGVSIIVSLLGVAQYFNFPHGELAPGEGHDHVLAYLENTGRLDISLGNATYVGAYMLVNVMIAVALLARSFEADQASPARRPTRAAERRRRRRRTSAATDQSPIIWWRLFWVTAIGLDLWMLFLSATRGAVFGLLAAVVAFAIAYVIWGRYRRLQYVSAGLLGAVVLLAVVFLGVRGTGWFQSAAESNLTLQKFASIGLSDNSIRVRMSSLRAALEGFAARPILGWGPENFTVAYDRYVTADAFSLSAESFDQAHNKLAEELTTKGILGFLSYVILWIFMVRVLVRKFRDRESPDQLMVMLVGAALVGYFVQNLFLFDTPATILQFIILLGFVMGLDSTLREDPKVASATRESTTPEAEPSVVFVAARVLAVALIFFVLGYLYFLNVRAWAASGKVLTVFDSRITWDQRLGRFEDSFDTFPPLANYPRLILFTTVAGNWSGLTAGEQEAALTLVERESSRAIESEPKGWRNHIALAQLYLAVSRGDAKFLDLAMSQIERATELAPERVEVHRSRVRVKMARNDYEGAWAVIEAYLDLNPDTAHLFKDLLAHPTIFRLQVQEVIAIEEYERARSMIAAHIDRNPGAAPLFEDLAAQIEAATAP